MKDGLFSAGSVFTLRYLFQDIQQISFVAPKSIIKTAIMRNKLRRQGYSAIRSINPPFNKKVAGIFFYKKQSQIPTRQDIKKDLLAIFHKL